MKTNENLKFFYIFTTNKFPNLFFIHEMPIASIVFIFLEDFFGTCSVTLDLVQRL